MDDLEQGAQSGTDPAQSGTGITPGNASPDNTSDNSNSGASGADAKVETKPAARYTEEEVEAIRKRMQAADQRASQYEKELRQLKDKDLPELERLNRDLTEISAERDRLREDLNKARLENAFLQDNKYKWKNPRAALKLADLSKVEVHEDGTVTGLTAALDALARSDPYLLDTEEGKTEEAKGSTGVPGTNSVKKQDNGTDLKKLAVRLPALRSRGLGT